jgi:uncharacterized membrane protein
MGSKTKGLLLRIKILGIAFLLFAIGDFFWMLGTQPTLKTSASAYYQAGQTFGFYLRSIFYISINLLAYIGLLRLKSWGILCASVALIFRGIAFGISLGLGLAKGYTKGLGSDSDVMIATAAVTGLLLAGTIVFMLIRYMLKIFKRLQDRYLIR